MPPVAHPTLLESIEALAGFVVKVPGDVAKLLHESTTYPSVLFPVSGFPYMT
jgi:hypothetical protein